LAVLRLRAGQFEHLTDQGIMDPALLYDPPFTDIAPIM
jgi:hypothetical protein